MPTTYTDQFFFLDPANPPGVGATLNFSVLSLTDQNDDLDFDAFDNDSVNGSDITQSYPGDTVTVNVPGVGNVTYTGITFYLANGTQVFTPTDGQVLENGTFVSSTWVNTQGPLNVSDMGPPCFVAGTLLDTALGPRPIERIVVGDLVDTLDRGLQPVRWVGARAVRGGGDFAPIRFAPGAIGNDRALFLSPQHRVLIRGWQAELYYGQDEILVAAKHLVDGRSVQVAPRPVVTYHHLMFDRHEIVRAEGVDSESFHPGDYMLQGDAALRSELTALFPELTVPARAPAWRTARPVLRATEAAVLAGNMAQAA
ncbi:MAG: Hint domain [Rhodobacteraceae bacterium HLUCCA08]|nr:MAG: Hint domain [Rhodobacteraceae bacterium HLUCCA08]